MKNEQEKAYRKTIEYVWKQIYTGKLQPGQRLPAERELAAALQISRNSVREGLRVLENMGILESHHGSGNYLSMHFGEMMSVLLSYMYFLKGMDEKQITEFRWAMEREALPLACRRITEEEKADLKECLDHLLEASSEEERILYDRRLHSLIVSACGNDFMIINYNALTHLMDTYIQSMRKRVIKAMNSRSRLEAAHENLVLGVIENDLNRASRGLEEHFGFVELYGK